MRLLAIESSCDETSAAIIDDGQVQAVVVSLLALVLGEVLLDKDHRTARVGRADRTQ